MIVTLTLLIDEFSDQTSNRLQKALLINLDET